AEPGRAGDCSRNRQLGHEADLSSGLLSSLRSSAAARTFWATASCWAFHQGRGNRAALFLRGGVGCGDFPNAFAGVVEDIAQVSSDEPDQAGRLRAELVCCRRSCCLWDAPPYAPDCPRTTDGRGLESTPAEKSLGMERVGGFRL